LSLRDGPLGDIKPPVVWMAAVALAVALVVALALFVGDRRETMKSGAYATTRRAVDSVAGPIGDVLSTPVGWVGDGLNGVQDYFVAGAQNHELKLELARARTWRDRALALQEENDRYRALLGVRTDPPMPMVFARTVIDARGPFSNSRLMNVGASRGVVEGNPALSEHGLVGRVTGVSATASRIMLLTDVESRTPVLIARTNGRAILTGDGGPSPRLDYLRTHDPVRPGDRVLTSGDGGVLPRGLPIGVAIRGFDGAWRVALDSDASPIDFVQILLYKDFSQLIVPGELQPLQLPSTATAPAAAAPSAAPTPPPGSSKP
jgi:rod shape-determining protein MreC